MGTGTLSLVGDWDEKTNSATLIGYLTNPVTKNSIRVKQVLSFADKDTLVIESYDQEGDGAEKLTVVYRLVRK